MRHVKIGAPGYILRDHLAHDLVGTLEKLRTLGFDGIEITGFFQKGAEEISSACQAAGIEPFGCYAMLPHMLCEPLAENELSGEWKAFVDMMSMPGGSPDEVMNYIKEIGCEYIGLCISSNPPTQELFDQISRASVLARKHGVKLQYHNHNYEYTNMINSEYRMDFILRSIPDDVLFEPDLGWMAIGGYPPLKALEKYKARIEIVHLKDYYRAGKNKLDSSKDFQFRPTGYGVLDWATILSYCEHNIQPKWYVADHDMSYHRDVFEELAISVAFIRHALCYCDNKQ